MRYIEAPNEFEGDAPAVFLAGGISDAENWQQRFLQLLPRCQFAILNPRRSHFPSDNLNAEVEQIEWEHRHLRRAELVVFWFPPQTLCPIALFELGACCAAKTPIVVGTDPGYARRADVQIHLRLWRPNMQIADSLEALAKQAAEYIERKKYR